MLGKKIYLDINSVKEIGSAQEAVAAVAVEVARRQLEDHLARTVTTDSLPDLAFAAETASLKCHLTSAQLELNMTRNERLIHEIEEQVGLLLKRTG